MGFDAGTIRAALELDSEQFDEDLDKAQERAQAFERESIKVPASLEKEEFDANADEVQERKDRLEEPIDIPAKIDNAELAASAAEAEAIIEAVKESAKEGDGEGLLSLNPERMEEEVQEARSLIQSIAATASEASGGQGLVSMMLGSGASQAEALAGLKSLGFGAGEAKDMISAYSLAQKLLPSAPEITAAVKDQLETGFEDAFYQLSYDLANWRFGGLSAGGMLGQGSGGGSLLPFLGALGGGDGIEDAEWWDTPPSAALDGLGNQAAIGPGPLMAMLGPGSPVAKSIDDVDIAARAEASALRTAALSGADSSANFARALRDGGASIEEIAEHFGTDVKGATSMLARTLGSAGEDLGAAATAGAIDLTMIGDEVDQHLGGFTTNLVGASQYLKNIANGGDSAVKGKVQSVLNSIGGGIGQVTNPINSAASSIPGVVGGLPGLATEIPIAASAGLALGGAVAGTSIGAAGALWALVPGLLDLFKGYTAYTNDQAAKKTPNAATYTAAAGASPGAQAVAGGISGLISSTAPLIGGLETAVNPQIVQFLQSLGVAMQSVGPFAVVATSAMGSFFGTIDKGLTSGGFKTFMAQMTADVGPIMKDFGGTIINLGKAFGSFLSIFGGAPAQMVGKWFDTETGKLATFLSHAKISPSFMAGAERVFTVLAKAITLAWDASKKLAEGLAPIGAFFLREAAPVLQFADHLIKMIPPQLITGLGAAVIGLMALGKAIQFIGTTIAIFEAIDWEATLVVGALVLLGLGAYELATHWHQVWGDIKNWFDDAVQFLRSGFGTLALLLLGPIGPLLFLALHWQTVWDTAKTVWHDFYNDVAGPLIDFFTNSVPNAFDHFKNAVTIAWQWVDGNVFQPIGSFFNTVLTGALNTAKSAWDSVWGGIQKTLQGVWNIISPILDKISSAISTISSGAGKVASVLSGSAHLGPIPYALGGGFTGNSPMLVGENGPELIFPKSAGYVVPNNRLNVGGGSGPSIVIQVDARGATDANAVRSAATTGVNSSLPKLRAALERGSGSMVPA